jgi:hypothetical protein
MEQKCSYLTAAYMNFVDRVVIAPNAIALEHNDEKLLTYNCTKSQSNGILVQGLRPNEIVTVSLDRSQILLPLFFAVLQCGMLRSYR